MRAVPRDLFVPSALAGEAWDNVPLPIGAGQTISQPLVVARMLQLLQLHGGERILDVGTGSGYHAALLAHLGAHVWSVERHRDLSEQARRNLDAAGDLQRHAGRRRRRARPARRPRRSTPSTSPPRPATTSPRRWSTSSGASGRLVVPVQTGDQRLWLVHHTPGGRFERKGLERVRFVPLVS